MNPDPVIKATLQGLIDGGHTTVRQLSLITATPRSTWYDWLAQNGPKVPGEALAILMARHPSVEVQSALMSAMSNGRADIHEEPEDFDFNGDGREDHEDLIDMAAEKCCASGEALKTLRTTFKRGLDSDGLVASCAALRKVRVLCDLSERLLYRLHQSNGTRRKARPVSEPDHSRNGSGVRQ
jgi:hypothetical protein